MAGRPVFGGADHSTTRLVPPSVSVTRGNLGASGGSSTSWTPMVTRMLSVPPLPSETVMVTSWLVFAS